MRMQYGRLGKAIWPRSLARQGWPLAELRACSLPEETLGRDVNSSGTIVPPEAGLGRGVTVSLGRRSFDFDPSCKPLWFALRVFTGRE
jgi:hypothetical protein